MMNDERRSRGTAGGAGPRGSAALGRTALGRAQTAALPDVQVDQRRPTGAAADGAQVLLDAGPVLDRPGRRRLPARPVPVDAVGLLATHALLDRQHRQRDRRPPQG